MQYVNIFRVLKVSSTMRVFLSLNLLRTFINKERTTGAKGLLKPLAKIPRIFKSQMTTLKLL